MEWKTWSWVFFKRVISNLTPFFPLFWLRWLKQLVSYSPFIFGWTFRFLMTMGYLLIMLTLSIIFYWIIYWYVIPVIHQEYPIYFDYTQQPFPSSIVPISSASTASSLSLSLSSSTLYILSFLPLLPNLINVNPWLSLNQYYDISIFMRVPNKQSVPELGNVMFSVELYSCSMEDEKDQSSGFFLFSRSTPSSKSEHTLKTQLLTRESRPLLVEYQPSSIKDYVNRVSFFLPHIWRPKTSDQFIKVPVIQNFYHNQEHPICQSKVIMSDPEFPIYDASLNFDCQLYGLPYWLYHWWLTSFMFGLMGCVAICATCCSPLLIFGCLRINALERYLKFFMNGGVGVDADVDVDIDADADAEPVDTTQDVEIEDHTRTTTFRKQPGDTSGDYVKSVDNGVPYRATADGNDNNNKPVQPSSKKTKRKRRKRNFDLLHTDEISPILQRSENEDNERYRSNGNTKMETFTLSSTETQPLLKKIV